MNLSELIENAHENATKKGFWDDWNVIERINARNKEEETKQVEMLENTFISRNLMLIVGEAAEAQEALRKGDEANFREELADILIRLCDLCGGLSVDLEYEVLKKMEKNKSRPRLHGKAF